MLSTYILRIPRQRSAHRLRGWTRGWEAAWVRRDSHRAREAACLLHIDVMVAGNNSDHDDYIQTIEPVINHIHRSPYLPRWWSSCQGRMLWPASCLQGTAVCRLAPQCHSTSARRQQPVVSMMTRQLVVISFVINNSIIRIILIVSIALNGCALPHNTSVAFLS